MSKQACVCRMSVYNTTSSREVHVIEDQLDCSTDDSIIEQADSIGPHAQRYAPALFAPQMHLKNFQMLVEGMPSTTGQALSQPLDHVQHLMQPLEGRLID